MDKLGTTLVKVVALAGGAFLGTLLGRWMDELMRTQAHKQSEYDKTRYEQGLAPVEPPSPTTDR